MKRQLFLFILFLLTLQVFANDQKLLEDFFTANRIFAADCYKELAKRSNGNILICPMSAEIILGLARYGAKGNTAKELALHIQSNVEDTRNMFLLLNKKLYANDKYILTCANNIYLNKKYVISNEFKGAAYGDFKAGVQNLDFSRAEETVDYVNSWVEKKTHRKITNLLSTDRITADTAAVLVNTMYFRGNWINQFDPQSTQKKKFYVNDKKTVELDMISLDGYFNYFDSKELDAQFLEMQFEGDDMAMTFILPREKFGLEPLETTISDVLLPRYYKLCEVQVSLPKFTLESEIDFKPVLKALGVKESFTIKANFSGISKCEPALHLNQIIQKTFLEINEKGATAAASTTVVCPSQTRAKNQFSADHPFLFYVKHKSAGFILVGKYVGSAL